MIKQVFRNCEQVVSCYPVICPFAKFTAQELWDCPFGVDFFFLSKIDTMVGKTTVYSESS